MYRTCNYTGYSNRLLLYLCIYCIAESFFCVPPARYGNYTAAVVPLVTSGFTAEATYNEYMPEAWLHHNISFLCPVKRNLMHALKFEMSFNENSLILIT